MFIPLHRRSDGVAQLFNLSFIRSFTDLKPAVGTLVVWDDDSYIEVAETIQAVRMLILRAAQVNNAT